MPVKVPEMVEPGVVEPEANARKTIPVGIRIAVGAAVVVRPAAIWGIRPDRDSPEPKSVEAMEAMEAIEMPAHYVAVADDMHGDLHRAAAVHGRDRVLADR
jgi:hypothetical protein